MQENINKRIEEILKKNSDDYNAEDEDTKQNARNAFNEFASYIKSETLKEVEKLKEETCIDEEIFAYNRVLQALKVD